MTALLERALRWLAQKAGSLLVILAILIAVGWINSELERQRQDRLTLQTMVSARDGLVAELRQLDARVSKWRAADLDGRASSARKKADVAKSRLDTLEKESAWWDPIVDRNKVVRLEAARLEYAAWEKAVRKIEALRDRSPLESLEDERERKTRAISELDPSIRKLREKVEQDPKQLLLAQARAKLPIAFWILVGLSLTPPLIKVIFYYLLAPLAEKLPAIRIIPDDGAPAIPEPPGSAVSIPFDIGAEEEILVHSDFLQSSGRDAPKRTQWFLNPHIPFSSIASGMAVLTRISSRSGAKTRVVVSSQRDPLGEIGVIDVPPGAAMVVQPRSLAGIVKPVGSDVRITRHWRLSSLHAWLTLQLRYLAFHGPCKLIIKGCRGVRAEAPGPDEPRLINQAATLGFSANLDYRNTRCETFVSYFRGKEDLFNDLFSGGPGLFVYEEMPRGGRKTGITGRGLEGWVDAVLGAFGI